MKKLAKKAWIKFDRLIFSNSWVCGAFITLVLAVCLMIVSKL